MKHWKTHYAGICILCDLDITLRLWICQHIRFNDCLSKWEEAWLNCPAWNKKLQNMVSYHWLMCLVMGVFLFVLLSEFQSLLCIWKSQHVKHSRELSGTQTFLRHVSVVRGTRQSFSPEEQDHLSESSAARWVMWLGVVIFRLWQTYCTGASK